MFGDRAVESQQVLILYEDNRKDAASFLITALIFFTSPLLTREGGEDSLNGVQSLEVSLVHSFKEFSLGTAVSGGEVSRLSAVPSSRPISSMVVFDVGPHRGGKGKRPRIHAWRSSSCPWAHSCVPCPSGHWEAHREPQCRELSCVLPQPGWVGSSVALPSPHYSCAQFLGGVAGTPPQSLAWLTAPYQGDQMLYCPSQDVSEDERRSF